MKIVFCPECKQRIYIFWYDENHDNIRCANCGNRFELNMENAIDEFDYDKYPEGWQK